MKDRRISLFYSGIKYSIDTDNYQEIASLARLDSQRSIQIAEYARADSVRSIQIAELARLDSLNAMRDGKQMKAIALLTMIFLPGTFIAVSIYFDLVIASANT